MKQRLLTTLPPHQVVFTVSQCRLKLFLKKTGIKICLKQSFKKRQQKHFKFESAVYCMNLVSLSYTTFQYVILFCKTNKLQNMNNTIEKYQDYSDSRIMIGKLKCVERKCIVEPRTLKSTQNKLG